MTGRRSRRNRHHPAAVAGVAAAGLVLAVLALHMIGWLLATAIIAASAWLAGRRGPAAVQPGARAAASADARAGTTGPPAAERGQLAAVTAERDQLAAAVADLTRQLGRRASREHQAAERAEHDRQAAAGAAVLREVAAGLVNLGWPARDAKTAAAAALSAVRADLRRRAADTPTVLREALAHAGKNRSQLIPPAA